MVNYPRYGLPYSSDCLPGQMRRAFCRLCCAKYLASGFPVGNGCSMISLLSSCWPCRIRIPQCRVAVLPGGGGRLAWRRSRLPASAICSTQSDFGHQQCEGRRRLWVRLPTSTGERLPFSSCRPRRTAARPTRMTSTSSTTFGLVKSQSPPQARTHARSTGERSSRQRPVAGERGES